MTPVRERVLDAASAQIVELGVAALTLEAVAARAGVSKGGLLYHFRSKQALVDGLADRLRAYTDANLERAARDGVVRVFLETSLPGEHEALQYRAVLAAVQSGSGDVSDHTRAVVADVFEDWSRLLDGAVRDPVLADVVRMVGDGLYLGAVTGLPGPSPQRARALVERLVSEAG